MIIPTGEIEANLRANGLFFIAGVDEAGCGAIAGPVVAGAVILPVDHGLGVRDSKTLSARQRERLIGEIEKTATDFSAGIVDANLIDEIGIRPATLLAMKRAIEGLSQVEHLLIDARSLSDVSIPQTSITKGDQKEFCIAAASIVAKVTRDRLMIAAHDLYPQYEFASHKGYGTQVHRKAVGVHGHSPLHRKSFEYAT